MQEHHAYLVRTDVYPTKPTSSLVGRLGVFDVDYVSIESFGIGDVRSLIEKAFVRPTVGKNQLIVVSLKAITIEAQQALLKILEEPPTSTILLFCVPKTLYLLPTLLSRFLEEKVSTEDTEVRTYEVFKEFSSLKVADRITELTNRLTKKDLQWVEQIKAGLLDKLVNNGRTLDSTKLAILFWVAEHLQTRGASNKMLLEELALSLD